MSKVKEKKEYDKLAKFAIKSKNNYSCPKCGAWCVKPTMVAMTEPDFFGDSSYTWQELHKCPKCETLYTIENGT